MYARLAGRAPSRARSAGSPRPRGNCLRRGMLLLLLLLWLWLLLWLLLLLLLLLLLWLWLWLWLLAE